MVRKGRLYVVFIFFVFCYYFFHIINYICIFYFYFSYKTKKKGYRNWEFPIDNQNFLCLFYLKNILKNKMLCLNFCSLYPFKKIWKNHILCFTFCIFQDKIPYYSPQYRSYKNTYLSLVYMKLVSKR